MMAEGGEGVSASTSAFSRRSRSAPSQCRSYPDLRVALPGAAKIARLIAEARPDSIHIATEGPIGLAVRRYCRKRGLPFTTSFHTRFPEYISARLPIPESWSWSALRWFHGASQAVMAATPAAGRANCAACGFRNVVLWPRGVDAQLFRPRAVDLGVAAPDLSVGRPGRGRKESRSVSRTRFAGHQGRGRRWPCACGLAAEISASRLSRRAARRTLAEAYAAADVFVFPSKTDTSVWCFWRRWRAACRWRRFR